MLTGAAVMMKLITPNATAPESAALRHIGSRISALSVGPLLEVDSTVDSVGRSLHRTIAPSAYKSPTTIKEPAYSCSANHARPAIAACGPTSADPSPPTNTYEIA